MKVSAEQILAAIIENSGCNGEFWIHNMNSKALAKTKAKDYEIEEIKNEYETAIRLKIVD